jgi:hypothetical protein
MKRIKEALACELARPLIGCTQCPDDSAGEDNEEKNVDSHDVRKTGNN